MHRWTIALLGLAGLLACEPHYIAKPLPALVVAQAPTAAVVRSLLLPPGEQLIWEVQARGLTIGRAELVVGADEVHSKFGTNELASKFAVVHHEMTTVIDRVNAVPLRVSELAQFDGTIRQGAVTFDATGYRDQIHHSLPDGKSDRIHTFHTALGWLRAWADPGAANAYLYVLAAGKLYRLDVEAPVVEDLLGTSTLRITGRALAVEKAGEPIALSIWLTNDPARTPQRLAISVAGIRVTAELIAAK